MSFVNEKENQKTIDCERGVYLTHLSTMPRENYHVFKLVWGEIEIYFGAYNTSRTSDDNKMDVFWEISQLDYDSKFRNKRQEIISLISESLETYGYLYRTDVISSVSVKFNISQGRAQ